MARRFYETSIPEAVRNQGEGAVRNFLNGKHASHIKSVSKAPDWAKRPSNVLWEDARKNLSRGSRNMTAGEVAAIESANRVSVIGAAAKSAAKVGLISAVIEALVAGPENFFHWKRGRKSSERSAVDAAKSTAVASAVGAGVTVGAAVAAKGAALVGISPTLGPAGVPLAVAGGALMVGSSVYRVIKAAKQDLPLCEYTLFFCKDTDCKIEFARDVASAALGRD